MEDTVTMTLDRYEAMLAENISLKNKIEDMQKVTKIDDKTVYNEPMVEWRLIPYYRIEALSEYEYAKMMERNQLTIVELKKAQEDDDTFETLLGLKAGKSYGDATVLEIQTGYATTTIKFGTNTYYVALDRNYPNIISEKSFDEGSLYHDYDRALLAGKAKVRKILGQVIKSIEEKGKAAV